MNAIAQISITGSVVETGTAKPVAAASVFVSNSSSGTSTDVYGNFILKKPPAGKFTLVVSCIGYETFVKDFDAGKINLKIRIELRQKTADLREVIVTPQDKNGWINWGDLFIEHFIGTSVYARGCKIKNPSILKFRRDYKDSILTVSADEPLIIENRLLGYIIKYELKEFTYFFPGNTVRYSGYPLFEEMVADDKKTELKYRENRMKAYDISLVHFIRSLYNETTEAEGFRITRKINNKTIEVKKSVAMKAQEYNGVESYDTIYEISNTNTQIKIVAIENADAQKNNSEMSDKSSMANIFSYDNGAGMLNFTDTLQIIYTKANAPFEYIKYAEGSTSGKAIVSEISLIQQGPVTVMSNGSFTPANLVMNGFWGWWEKISIMLPYDYELPGKL
jgi:CarboxypepD_reg-like domain